MEEIKEEGNLLEQSKAQERAFWQEKLELCQEGSADYRQVKHRLYEIDVADAKQAVQMQIAQIKEQMASEKESWTQRLADQDRIVAINAQAYGKDSLNYQNAVNEKKKMQEGADKADRDLADKRLENSLKLARMDVEAQKEKLNQEKSLGIISASEELAQLKALKEQEIALEKQNFEQRQTIWAQYPKKMAEILQEVQVAEKKNALEIQKSEAQAAQAVEDKWKAAMAPIDSAMTTAINGMIQGTQSMQKMVGKILQDILTSYINLAAKSLQNWIATEAAKLLSTQTTSAQVVAAETAAAPEAATTRLSPTFRRSAAPRPRRAVAAACGDGRHPGGGAGNGGRGRGPNLCGHHGLRGDGPRRGPAAGTCPPTPWPTSTNRRWSSPPPWPRGCGAWWPAAGGTPAPRAATFTFTSAQWTATPSRVFSRTTATTWPRRSNPPCATADA